MTKPTRLQEQACDRLAEALGLITEAVRLDGKSRFGPTDLNELAGLLTRATSAFGLDQVVARSLERRGRALGVRPGTGELLVLVEGDRPPLELLLLADDDFRARVEAAEQELGGPE
jgi:hypothetical protein